MVTGVKCDNCDNLIKLERTKRNEITGNLQCKRCLQIWEGMLNKVGKHVEVVGEFISDDKSEHVLLHSDGSSVKLDTGKKKGD